MKKLHLKKWVKVVLYVLGILALIIMIKWGTQNQRKAIIQCVEGGNTVKYCEYHLNK